MSQKHAAILWLNEAFKQPWVSYHHFFWNLEVVHVLRENDRQP